MEMPMKNLKAADILEDLESKLAYIPGGRDHDGRPLIVINVPPEFDSATKSKLEFLILYFISIFRYRIFDISLMYTTDVYTLKKKKNIYIYIFIHISDLIFIDD